MKRLYMVKLKDDKSRTIATLCYSDYEYNELNNNCDILDTLKLVVNGANYKQKQVNAQELAIQSQCFDCECDLHFDFWELSAIANYFEKVGKQYGLLKEFKENCIC